MLPEDAKQHKLLAFDKAWQSLITDHFSPEDAQPSLYSDSTFRAATIEWLIEMNQVRQFLWNITLHFILTKLRLTAATSDIWPSNVQEYGWHRIPNQTWGQLAITQTVKGVHPPDVQRTVAIAVCSPFGMFLTFLHWFLSTNKLLRCHWLHVRAPLSGVKSASHVMRGRPATPMHTSQWLATGLRSMWLASEPPRLH